MPRRRQSPPSSDSGGAVTLGARETVAVINPRHTVVLDWDGTLVPAMWPERPTRFLPGAVQACLTMHRAGFALLVASARLNPYNPFTSQERPASEVESEALWMRDMLDEAGLTFVQIWRLPGKASGSIYVDDRAIRYTGRPGSWRAVTEKVFALLGVEEPKFPEFDFSKEAVRT